MQDNRTRMIAGEIVAQRFEIESRAAAGGMGAVYRARDRVSGAPVAVKLVLDAENQSTRFAQEARVLCELDHPAIVRYVMHGVDAGRPYLVMEWLEGEDLATRLARGPLSVEETLSIARRLAEALSIAHARGVVHRDIKPANLFLPGGDVSRVKLLDFGIARAASAGGYDTTILPITRTGTVLGTVGYMSPEQARGAADLDARTDVFALGCVLYECLAGRPAFAGPNAVAVLAKVLLEDAPRLRDAPPALAELLARMLSRDPAKRPRDGAQLARALDATSLSTPAASSSGGLGDREQRLMSVVLARGIAAAHAAPVLEGRELIRLADGALLVAERGNDATTHAAAIALALRRIAPSGSIAVATGRVSNEPDGWVGPIIDRAATILAAAPDIAIDDLSATLLRDRFQVVGDDGAFRLAGAARAVSEPRTLLGKRTPFVGRDKELALLEATFEECVSEPIARAVLVTAPPGSGKSRLQHELLGRVRGRATVLFSRGDPIGAGSALGVIRQLVRNAANVREGDDPSVQHEVLRAHLATFFAGEALDRCSDMLGELIGAPPSSPGVALRAAREDTRILASLVRRAFGEWLSAMAESPLLLVIEDLHWGDPTSVAYLEEAVRNNASAPLMVLALARPEVHDLFPELWQRVDVQELRLPALTRRAAERLVRSVLEGAGDDTIAHVVARAEGNAFSLEELIRHVAERSDAALPDSVLALAEARVARLDPERRRMLRVASLFGEVFWSGAVATLMDESDVARVDAQLRELAADEVLVARPRSRFAGGEYAFRHGLLRDVAYATLTDDDRRAGHARAGQWLEEHGESEPLVLGDHYERAGDPRRAAPWLLRACERAFDGSDFGAGSAIAERGARMADGEVLGRFRVVQAIAAIGRGDHATGVRHAKEAYALLPRGSAHAYLAAANVLSSGAHVGDFELAPVVVQDLLTTEPSDPPGGAYGLAVQIVCDILESLGQSDSCERLIARAESLARDHETCDPTFLGWLAFSKASLSVRRDELAVAFDLVTTSRAHFARVGAMFGVAMCDFGLGVAYSEIGQGDRARALLRDAATAFAQMGTPMFELWCRLHIAWTHLIERRPDEAIAAARPALYTLDHRHACAVTAVALVDKGAVEQAAEVVREALTGIDEQLTTPWVVAFVHLADGVVQRARGELRGALGAVERARAVTGRTPSLIRSWIDALHAECLRDLGEREALLEVLPRAVSRIDAHFRALPPELARTFPDVRPLATIARLTAELL